MKGLFLLCLYLLVSGVSCHGQALGPLTGHWQQISKLDGPFLHCGQVIPPGAHLPSDLAINRVFQFKDKLYLDSVNTACSQERFLEVSSDNGATWLPLSAPSDIGKPLHLGVADGALYVFGDKGFSISKDANNWGSTIARVGCDGPFELETKGIMVLCGSSFWHSVDHGATWSQLPLTMPVAGARIIEIIVTGDVLFRAFTTNVNGKSVPSFFRSTDLGARWVEVGPPYGSAITGGSVPIAMGRRNLYIQMSDNGQNLFGVSTDHGASWTLRPVIEGVWVTPGSFVELPDSRICSSGFSGFRGGVYCSSDAGATWQWLTNGFPTSGNQYPWGTLVQSNAIFMLSSPPGSFPVAPSTLFEFVSE